MPTPDLLRRVSHLAGARLALWVARTEGHNDAFCWQDHAGRMQVYLRSTDQKPFMPHESWIDCGPVLALLLAAGCTIMQSTNCVEYVVVGPFGRWAGATPQEAICRARVGLRYGDEVAS